jgi:hypothetical protein
MNYPIRTEVLLKRVANAGISPIRRMHIYALLFINSIKHVLHLQLLTVHAEALDSSSLDPAENTKANMRCRAKSSVCHAHPTYTT